MKFQYFSRRMGVSFQGWIVFLRANEAENILPPCCPYPLSNLIDAIEIEIEIKKWCESYSLTSSCVCSKLSVEESTCSEIPWQIQEMFPAVDA